MEESNKSEDEKSRQIAQSDHDTIVYILKILVKKWEKEAKFWKSLRKYLNGVKSENGKS